MEQSLNPDLEAAQDRWFGSQAAADYLNIHRSTLFLAMRREHLIPDEHTPGGFARFKQSTLEAFRHRISEEAATGTAPVFMPIHTLAQLSHEVKDMTPIWSQRHRFLLEKELPIEVKEICESVVSALGKPPVHAPMCLLAFRTFSPHCVYELKPAAQAGLGPGFFRDYRWLRNQPNTQFVTDETLAYGKEVYCPDTKLIPPEFNATRQIVEKQGIRSYLGLPISSGDLTLGLLLVLDNAPRQFSQHDRAFLAGVTDQVALAINAYSRADRLDSYAQTGQLLTQIGLGAQAELRRARNAAERLQAQRDAIAKLLSVFQTGANAENAYVLNLPSIEPPMNVCPDLGRLTSYALREGQQGDQRLQCAPDATCVSHGYSKDEKGVCMGEWRLQGRQYTGLALGITVPPATPAAVGASWRCLEPAGEAAYTSPLMAVTPEDHALLVTLAGACALVMAA